MNINLSKLSPAPWYVKDGRSVKALQDEPNTQPVEADEAFTVAATHSSPFAPRRDIAAANAAFIALARNAFDVMMRRGWSPALWAFGEKSPEPFWALNCHAMPADGKLYCWVIKQEFPDPFTALVEADKWYTANVENETAATTALPSTL